MKKTLITLLALTGVATAIEAFQYSGDFSWGSGQDLSFTFDENIALSVTSLSSDKNYKEVKYYNTEESALTNIWGGYSPDVNVGNGGSWTLSLTLTNTSKTEALTLNTITLDAVIYDSNGKFQPNYTDRNITFTFGGAASGNVTKTLKGSGEASDSGRTENITLVELALGTPLTIAADSSVTISITASPKAGEDGSLTYINDKGQEVKYSNGGTFVGLKSMTCTTASAVPAIPEPATATLSLLALAGLAARRRRR